MSQQKLTGKFKASQPSRYIDQTWHAAHPMVEERACAPSKTRHENPQKYMPALVPRKTQETSL